MRRRYTESGRGLSIASSRHCFDTYSARPIGDIAKDTQGRMPDSSAEGTRVVYPVYEVTATALLAAVNATGETRLPGCSVWNYRASKEVLRWSMPGLAKLGLLRATPTGREPAFALSRAGDCLAVTWRTSVWLRSLPAT